MVPTRVGYQMVVLATGGRVGATLPPAGSIVIAKALVAEAVSRLNATVSGWLPSRPTEMGWPSIIAHNW